MGSEKLLPCPFCNGEGLGVTSVRDGYEVWCRCGAQMTAHNPNGRAKAIAAWNTRAPADLRSALEAETIERCERRARIQEALLATLDDSLDCTRVWSAWGYGTMGQDDFVPVLERLDELVDEFDAIIFAAALAPTKGDAS